MRIVLFLATAFVGSALLPACQPSRDLPAGSSEEQSAYLPNTSPENVLRNLQTAHHLRDIAGYEALFDTTYALQIRRGDADTVSGTFDYDMDMRMTHELFADAESLSLVFSINESTPSELPEFPSEDGFRQIRVNGVVLDGTAVPTGQDSLRTFHVETRDSMLFVFKPDDPIGPRSWRIVRWQCTQPVDPAEPATD
jgi:hypothetical protein